MKLSQGNLLETSKWIYKFRIIGFQQEIIYTFLSIELFIEFLPYVFFKNVTQIKQLK